MTTTLPAPPGPPARFFTGHLADFHRDVLGFYTRLAHDYGECAQFRLMHRPLVLLSNPHAIERVLLTESKCFAKLTYALKLIQPLLGQGLLLSDGAYWLRQRRLIQPAFSRQRILSYTACMQDFTELLSTGWHDSDTIDVHEEMMRLTLQIIAKVLFDADVTDDAADVGDALIEVMYSFLNRWRGMFLIPGWMPTQNNRRFQRAIRRLDNIIYRFIDDRRRDKRERHDLLSILLHARDEDDGSRMTDRQLRDETMTLFLAGHETTAAVLSYTWYLLAQHPEVEATLLEEIQSSKGDAVKVTTPGAYPYLEAVFHEAMRLYPPAYTVARITKDDIELCGYRIRAGTTVLSSQWVMHRHPNWWTVPEDFHPERWLDGSTKDVPHFVYFPFGGGPRKCIGDSFAMVETKLILALLLPKVHLELVPEHNFQLRPAVTLRPEFGIKMTVHRRDANTIVV